MNNQLYTYSMVKVLYDQGKDYVDSFWPFVLRILPSDKSFLSIDAIQNLIKDKYGIEIPQHSLGTIITRAKRRGFMTQKEKKCALTDSGLKYLNMLEPERDVDRRINEFIEDARCFVNENESVTLSSDDTKNLVQAFIKEHIEFFEQYVKPESAATQLGIRDKILRDYENSLLNYFSEVERAKPSIFKTLRDIVCGGIISAMIHSESFTESIRRFEHTSVYLDTNYVFSMLDLHFDEYNKPAQELLKLMESESAFKFRVFDFTVDEIVGVLRNYQNEQYLYLPSIKVSSIFSSLKAKGWTAADVREFIVKIEEKLWGLGIGIEPTKVDLEKYIPTKKEYRGILSRYKPGQGILGQNHDLAAIEKIMEIRRQSMWRIESAKAFFLTSDVRLTKYNFLEMGHKKKVTICEVILDRLLTNILWLKNPTLIKELPLKSIIAMHSRHLFIDKEVWKRFYDTVEDLRKKGNINEKDISILLYDQHIQEVLRTYDSENAEEVNAGFVLENIKDVKKHLDKAKEQELERQKGAFEERIAQIEKDKNERWYHALDRIKEGIKKEANKLAKYLYVGLVIMTVILLVVVSVWTIPLVLRKWDVIEPIVWLVSAFFSIIWFLLGFKFDPLRIRVRLREWLFNLIYLRKLRNLRVEELEDNLFESGVK